MLTIKTNCTPQQMLDLSTLSPSRTLKRITDRRTGNSYYWPAEHATHKQAADLIGLEYDKRPGEGEIIVFD